MKRTKVTHIAEVSCLAGEEGALGPVRLCILHHALFLDLHGSICVGKLLYAAQRSALPEHGAFPGYMAHLTDG